MTHIFVLSKMLGSPDPSPTKPPIKKIWGVIMKRKVKNESIEADKPDRFEYHLIPSFFLITKEDTELYDTLDDIPASPPIPIVKKHVDIFYVGGKRDGEKSETYI